MSFSLVLVLLGLVPIFLWRVTISPTNANEFFGAFLAAYFALIIFLIQKNVEQYFDKRRKNYLGIAKVQIECVKLVYAMTWNIKELQNLQKSMKPKKGKPNELFYYIMQPRKVFIDPAIIEGVKKIEFVQDFFNMFFKIEDMNSILDSTRQENERFEKLWFGKSIPNEVVEMRHERYLQEISEFQNQVNVVKDVLSKSRVFTKKGFFAKFFCKPGYSKKQNKNFQKEREAIDGMMPEYESETI